MKLTYDTDKEAIRERFRAIRGTMEGAVRAAFKRVAADVQAKGRAEIARSGLSRRWQSGFRTYVFPRVPNGKLDVAMRGQHRIGYANIFERGGAIAGRPLLWVPLPTAPAKINGKATTARSMIAAGVRLFKIERPGRPPLLAGYAMRFGGRKTSVAQLRTGQRNVRRRQARAAFGGGLGARPQAVPLFVGLSAVRIRDRLNVTAVYDRARQNLPEIYFAELRKVNR